MTEETVPQKPDPLNEKGNAAEWALYFEHQVWPIMPRSKTMFEVLEAFKGDRLSPNDLLPIVLQDSLLCLSLLRQASQKKSRRLEHETTTAKAALLRLGVNGFKTHLENTPEISEDNHGLNKVETRAKIASHLAQVWSEGRHDVEPEEVAVAALLGGIGDILLWLYAHEIPTRAQAKLASGQVARSAEAQRQSCGFSFKSLTVACAERWGISDLLVQLLKGSDSVRASLTRVCANTARHLLDETATADMALACDLKEAKALVGGVSLEWLARALPDMPQERVSAIVSLAQSLPDEAKEA